MEEVKIPITLDDSGFVTGAKRIIDRMEDTQKEVNKTGMSVDTFAKHMQDVYRHFDKLTAAVHENTAAIGQDSRAAKQLGRDLDETTEKGVAGFGRLEKAAIGFFTVQKAKEFISTVYEVRSEIEKLETSLTTFVGNKAEADALIASIRKIPMSIKDLSGAAETMMGFGVATNEVAEDLEAIGNIARGDSQRFQSLSLAFSQASSTGKLMGQDFLQMVNAGFNPLDQIAKTTGKDMATLKKEMSEGAISAEMMRQAFIDATSEGGKFNGMLEAQSKTMAGSYNELQRVIDDMLNGIGQNTEGIMKGAIDVATLLAKNYETVGRVLLGLIATYGTYRTAVMAVSVAEGIANGQIELKIRALRACATAQALLNKTMLANPYVLAATALAAVVSSLIAFRSKSDEASEAQKNLSEAFGETQAKIATEEKNIDSLFGKLRKAVKGTQEYKDAKKAIIDQYGQYFNGLDSEIEKVGGVELAYKKLTKAVRESTMARGKEAAMQQANDTYNSTYSDYIGRIYDTVKETAGEENAKNALRAIRADLKLTGMVAEDTENAIVRVSNGSVKRTWFGEINQAEQNLLETQKKVNAMYGEQKKEADEATNGANNLAKAYKKAEEEFKEANAIVEKMKANRSAYTDEQWNTWTEKLKKRKQALEDLGGDPDGKNAKKYANAAKENAELRQKQFDVEMADLERQSKEREEAYNASREAYIASIKNAGERERAAEDEQHRLNIAAINKEAEEMKKANLEAHKKTWEASNTDKTKKWADTDTAKAGWKAQSLTADQEKKITAELKKEYAERDRLLKERQQKEVQSMRDYMKEFGTLQQKRLAIQQEYDDKIADETDKTQREILEAQKKQALDAFDMEVLKAEIDWTTMFDGIGNALEGEMKSTLEKVEKYMKSRQYKSLTAQEKAEYVKLRNELYQKTGSGVGAFDFSIYNQIGDDMKAYQHAIKAAKIATLEHTEAVERLKKAREELSVAETKLKNTIPENWTEANRQYLEAKAKVQMAQTVANATGQQQTNAEGQVVETKGNLGKSTSEAAEAISRFASSLNEMNNGTLYGFANGLANLIQSITGSKDGNAVGGLIGALGSKAGGLIGAILQIIDALGDDPAGFIKGILDKVADVVDKILSSLISEIVPQILEGVGKIVAAIIEGIANLFTFGAAGSFFTPDDDGFKEMLSQFESLRDIWADIIEKKKDYLSQSWGEEAKKAAEEAIRIAQEAQARARAMANESLSYGASAGSSSIAVRMWDKGRYGDWRGNAQNIVSGLRSAGLGDAQFNNMYDMTAMTAKQLEWIRDNYRDLWVQLDEDYKASLENVIQYGQTVIDVENQLQEQLSGASFENVFDSAMESMYDLADGSEDVMDDIAENWQKMVNKMIVSGIIGNRMKADLQKWYDEEFTKIYDEGLSDKEIAQREKSAKESYNRIIDGYAQQIQDAKNKGLISPIPTKEDEEEATGTFESIRDAWASAIMDMKGDTESLGKDIAKIMFEGLVKSNIFNEGFDTWLDGWIERYNAALEVQAPSDRESRLNQLYQERDEKVKELTEDTKKYADATGYTAESTEELSNSLDKLADTLLDSLLEDKTAEEMGRDIAMSLIKEMLTTMLESDKYAERMEDIRKKWKKLLSGKEVDYTMNDVLNDIADLNKDIASDETISKLADQYKGLNKELEKTETVFSNLHDTFKNTLYSMEDDAKSFRKKLSETMLKDLIDKQVLDVPFTINGMTFENFEAYSKDWNKRYAKAIADGDSALLDQLIEELVNARQLTIDAAEEFRKRIKELEKSGDTTFSGMTDSFTSALMDMNTDADEWAQEIGKTISRRIVEQMLVAKSIQPLLDNLQDAFNEAMSADGATYQSVVADAAVQRELSAITASYPALKDAVQDLMKSLGVTLEESAEQELSLGDLGSTLLDSLTSAEDSAEDFGKRIGQTLIRQMLEALISADYGEEIERIRKHWDLALKGVSDESGVTYTLDDVRKEIFDLRKEMSEDGAIENLTSDFLSLNEAAAAADSTFKSLGDTLTSSLTDVTKSADDIGREIGQRLSQKIVQELIVGKHLQPYLDDLQEAFDVAVSATGSTPASVLSAVTPKIDAAVAATERWKSAAEAVGEAFRNVEAETPLSGLRSSILSDLMDIESDAKDFATDMTKLLTEAFVDKFVLGEAFDKKLEEWESEYRRIMVDPTLGDSGRSNELKRLGETIASYRQVKSEEAKTIQRLMGYAKGVEDQSAYMNTAERITYEQADWIGGVMTNLYMNQIEGNKVREAILSTLRGMERIGVGGGGYGEQIYNRLSTMSTYLLEIRNDVHAHLAEINAKVGQTNQLLGG